MNPLRPSLTCLATRAALAALCVFFSIVVPAATRPEGIAKLNAAFGQVLQQADVKQNLAARGLEPTTKTAPAELGAFMRREIAVWRDVVKTSGAKVYI